MSVAHLAHAHRSALRRRCHDHLGDRQPAPGPSHDRARGTGPDGDRGSLGGVHGGVLLRPFSRAAFRGLALVAALSACGARPVGPAPPVPPTGARDGALRVWLTWNAPVDLDLYLTDPTWETLYFANNPTRGGGRLERDARCDTVTASAIAVEGARVTEPAAGRYRVGVDFIDACGSGAQRVPFRVVVGLDGVRREVTGSAKPKEFQVIVLEFELERDASGAVVLKEDLR